MLKVYSKNKPVENITQNKVVFWAVCYCMVSLNAEGIQQKKTVENITQNKVVFWALDMFAVKTF